MTFATEQEVLELLKSHLRREVSGKIWRYLIDRRYVREVINDDLDIGSLADEYRQLEDLFRQREGAEGRRESRQVAEFHGDAHTIALEKLLASEAARNPAVVEFRREVFEDHLLRMDQVFNWIEKRCRDDGDPTLFLTVPVPVGHDVRSAKDGLIWPEPPLIVSEAAPASSVRRVFVEFLYLGSDGEPMPGTRPITQGGVLDALRRLGDRLESSFRWRRAEATTYILTGREPKLPTPRVVIEKDWTYGALSRITLELDTSVSPQEVSRAYQHARAELGQARHRPLSPKHLALAEFYGGSREKPWVEIMDEWNTKNPDRRYRNVRNFGRDCLQAWKRVLGGGD